MPRKKKKVPDSNKTNKRTISLKELATHLDLSPTSLSLVLNNAPAATSIPQETKNRIFEAAAKFNYRPNYFARSLRAQRSFTFGVIVPELSDGYSAMVLNGVESILSREGFFYLTACHLHRDDLLEKHPQLLMERQVEAIIAVDTPIRFNPIFPVVHVSGQEEIPGVTNVILNHQVAARLGIEHLHSLGHEKIAVIKGQVFSSDTEIRFQKIVEEAKALDLEIDEALVSQLEGDSPSPEIGYIAAKKLLAAKKEFTALFAFNDVSAIGAIQALREAGLRVPEDVSVLGFDDIYAAAFHNPSLTTIRQPLFEMGQIAAQSLLDKLTEQPAEFKSETVTVEPQLIVRQSTGPVK
ncbi:MAG: LacI family DNA-binding transcriptional regulator [Pyrinomonadaceae bacterium]